MTEEEIRQKIKKGCKLTKSFKWVMKDNMELNAVAKDIFIKHKQEVFDASMDVEEKLVEQSKELHKKFEEEIRLHKSEVDCWRNAFGSIPEAVKAHKLALVEQQKLSQCPHCLCMTKNVCGKCKEIKDDSKNRT